MKMRVKARGRSVKKKIALAIFVVLLIAALAFGYVQKQRSDYAENLYQATYFMQEGCIKAEDTCNLIQKRGTMQSGKSPTKRQINIQR